MDDLRNSINASSEIQDLRSQLIQAQGIMSKMYTEEEIQNALNLYTDEPPASYIKRDLIKILNKSRHKV